MPIRRERKRKAAEELRLSLLAGLSAEHVLGSLGQGAKDATWTLLLDAVMRLDHGLTRFGDELRGDCQACHGHLFSVGKLRAKCFDCGLDIDSHEYMRQQIERRNGASAALR